MGAAGPVDGGRVPRAETRDPLAETMTSRPLPAGGGGGGVVGGSVAGSVAGVGGSGSAGAAAALSAPVSAAADPGAPDLVTIGVAVPIPEPYGSTLQRWRESFKDPMARAIPTHVTLLPPTEIHRADLSAIEDHLAKAATAGHPFPMLLQGTDSFRPISPVTFVRVARGADDCARTEALVRSGILARDLRFPYHPHVTVAHELPEAVLEHAAATLADYEARFEVTGFALYEHGADGVWRVRREFPFGE